MSQNQRFLVALQSYLPCIFFFWFAVGDFLVHGQVFSDGVGAVRCGLDRVPIRRPAHWNLVPLIAIDKLLTHSLDSRRPWQCPAGESFFFSGLLTHLDCQWDSFVEIVLRSLS